MKTIIFTLLLTLGLTTTSWAQSAAKKPARTSKRVAKPAAPSEEPERSGLSSAITAALRLGYNIPSSKLSGGFIPDLEAGYRIGLGAIAIEPAFGFQHFSGDAAGSVASPQIGAGRAAYKQRASANVFEGRVRGWFDLGGIGSPLVGINVGAVSAETEQDSFGVTRTEADSALTWGLHAGWAYPIPAAYGNVELLLAYRQAAVDFVSAGEENLSGFQLMLGWHAAF